MKYSDPAGRTPYEINTVLLKHYYGEARSNTSGASLIEVVDALSKNPEHSLHLVAKAYLENRT